MTIGVVMNGKIQNVSLGFTEDAVPEGTHMCLVFTKEEERVNSLLKFLLSGLENNERCACFTERISEEDIRKYLESNRISYKECQDRDSVSVSKTNEVYFPENSFEPERMLSLLSDFYDDSEKLGFSACRVIGEMEPRIERISGGERLLEYESKVSLLVKEKPITTICQYDAKMFSGGVIMEILKVHPRMIVNGAVVQNPYFIEPEEYLAHSC